MIVAGDADVWSADLGVRLEAWTDEVVPKGVEVRHHGTYSPLYAWMYAYEKALKARIETLLRRPLGVWERRLFGPDGVFSEGLSNAFLHGHHRDTNRPIRVSCEVAERGLVFGVHDGGQGFAVGDAIAGLRKGAAYYHVAGNGLRSFANDPEIFASYEDGGRTLRLLVPLRPLGAAADHHGGSAHDDAPAPADHPSGTQAAGAVEPGGPDAQPAATPGGLQEALECSRALAQSLRSAFFLWQCESSSRLTLRHANAQAWRLLGRDSTSLLGQELEDIWPTARETGVRAGLLSVISAGRSWSRDDVWLGGAQSAALALVAFPLSAQHVGLILERGPNGMPAKAESPDSRKRIRLLLDRLPLGVAEIDTAGSVVAANSCFAELLGLAREDLAGTRLIDSVQGPEVATAVAEALAGQSATREGSFGCEASGRSFWGRLVAQGVVEPQGDVSGALVTIEDIGDRRKSLEAIQACEDELAAVYDCAPLLMILVDERRSVIRANRAAARLNAHGADPLRGLGVGHAARCLHALDEPRGCGFAATCDGCVVRETVLDTLATGNGHQRVPASLVQRPEGAGRIHLLVSTARLDTQRGRRVLVCVEDVSSLAKVESTLTETETRFRTLLEHSPEGIVVFDQEGVIVMANAACEALFGYSRTELLGRPIGTLISDAGTPTHEARRTATGQAASGGQLVDARHRDGTVFPVEVSLSVAETEQGPWLMQHVVDARPRLAADRAKREFVSVVSHELRTPLTSIRGSLGLLAGGVAGPLPPKAQPMVAIALSNSERLLRLINDILDMDKFESGQARFELRRVDLAALASGAVESNRGFAEQYGVTLRSEPGDVPLPCLADPDRLLQVLANLLSNAVKYSPSGGEVLLSVLRRGDRIEVSVENDGPTIPEEFRDAIFEKFTQVDASAERRRGGTGLGLAISKAIVERHGGSIGFRASPGRGTTFFFSLPAKD